MSKRLSASIRSIAVAAAVAVLPLTVSPAAQAQGTIVPMLTCPLGCGIPETYTALAAQMARANSDVLPAAQETPGYMYNVRAMAEESRWKKAAFGTEDTVIQAAFQGGTPELKKNIPEAIPIKFQLLYGEGMVAQGRFFITFDPNIKSIADLKGKRISIGLPTQSDWGMSAELLLEHAYGITEENSDIRHVTPPVMTQQLIDGNTDAALLALITNADGSIWWTGGLTSKLAASGKQLRYLSISQEALDTINKKFSFTWILGKVPPNTLPNQNKEVLVGLNRLYQAVHPQFPEDVAYKLVKSVAEFGPKLRESGIGLWKFWSIDGMVAGLTEENAHPGAIKAFKELGWWERRAKYPPMTYPEMR